MNQKISRQASRNMALSVILAVFLSVICLTSFYFGYNMIKKDILLFLTFHGITDRPLMPWEIPQKELDNILDGLKQHGFEPLSPKDFPAWQAGKLDPARRFMVSFDDGLTTSARAISKLKAERNIESVFFLVTNFLGKPGYITKEQIASLVKKDHCLIGLHGKTHAEPPKIIASGTDLAKELIEARAILAKAAGQKIAWYAYPFGAYDEKSVSAVAEAGFTFGFTIDARTIASNDRHLLLPRLMYLRGAKAAGEPVVQDWMPPQEETTGQLVVTLSMLFFMLAMRAWYQTFLWRKRLQR